MAYENLCMYCFRDMRGEQSCPHCGRDSRAAVPQIQMLPGSLVYHQRFLIGRALGQDASGIVYAAYDTRRENRLRIREYLPRDCAERLNDGAVVPVAGREDQFEAGLRRLRASVENAEDPRNRHFFFEENGTAYIAQRRTPPAAEPADEEPERRGSGRVVLFAGIAVAVLVVAAVLLITVFNGAISASRDITQTPTLDPSQVWIPATTPTATPYVAPTFAALVDPELSWMDYTYEGDVEREYQQAERAAASPTPTASPTAASAGDSRYSLVDEGSGRDAVLALQQKLSELGWLDESQVTGKYDKATRQAVRDVQRYVNQRYNPRGKLAVDGVAGPKTQQWLYEADLQKPTPTPTPRVTPKPDDGSVDEKSPEPRVLGLQQKLAALGLLPESAADGSYGATTAAAVRRFQKRVNELAGYDVLEPTGKADAQTLAFLDYYAEEWERLRQATAEPTATPKPTAKPTPTPTTRPVETLRGVIDASAPTDAIRGVQRLLIDIGMLAEGTADGIYGSGTLSAVADFQQWVNDQRNEQTLTVNGEVDELTLAYLQYCVDHGMKPRSTPTPAPTQPPATPEPTVEPIVPADAEPDTPEGGQEISVDRNSDPESIRYVQEMLSAVGAMDASGIDGVYGGGTARAVSRFQAWVNRVQGEDILPVTGEVDNRTRLALEYAFDHELRMEQADDAPTDAPTEAPTAPPADDEPDVPEGSQQISVDENSAPESIRFVQEMLSSVGLLDSGNMNGVYDAATTEAVRRFQSWVNRVQGEDILPVTGEVDDRTRTALEYAFDHELRVDTDDGEPTEAPGVGAVGEVEIAFGDAVAGDELVIVPEGAFKVNWRAEGDVDSYYVYVEDSEGNTLAAQEATDSTSFRVNTEKMAYGEVYTLRLGVLPARGDQQDIVWRTVRFALPERETPEPAPAVAEISAPNITIAGVAAGSSAVVIEDDTFQISWAAVGDVDSYYVRITDADGDDIAEPQRTTHTGVSLKAADMEEGMLYTLTVSALPVGGGEEDVKVSRAQFMRPVRNMPTPTEVPTPAPQVARIGTPVINFGGSAYQQDGVPYMTDSSIILSWSADGDVESYTVYVENESGERQQLGTTTDTSRTVNARSLPAGVYTIYVGATPRGGDREDMTWSSARFGIPAPEQPDEAGDRAGHVDDDVEDYRPEGGSEAVSGPISGSSDADTVQQLQMRLYSLGLLSTDGLEPGVLDAPTLRAVAQFQARVNEQFGDVLDVVDPADPNAVVDAETVRAIFAN